MSCGTHESCGTDCNCGCPYTGMEAKGRVELIAEVERRYPEEWLGFVIPPGEDEFAPERAMLVVHSDSDDEVWDAVARITHNQIVHVYYNGKLDPYAGDGGWDRGWGMRLMAEDMRGDDRRRMNSSFFIQLPRPPAACAADYELFRVEVGAARRTMKEEGYAKGRATRPSAHCPVRGGGQRCGHRRRAQLATTLTGAAEVPGPGSPPAAARPRSR